MEKEDQLNLQEKYLCLMSEKLLNELGKDEKLSNEDFLVKTLVATFIANKVLGDSLYNNNKTHNELKTLLDRAENLLVNPKLNMTADVLRDKVSNILNELYNEIYSVDIGASTNVPKLISKIPESYYIPNTKFSNKLTQKFPIDTEVILNVGKTKKPVYVYASLNYDDENISLSNRQPFTPYDRIVHNAVCTLYVAGNKVFTPEMVYRTMNGLTDTEHISDQAVKQVMKSIEKSRFIKATIDFTEELKMRKTDSIPEKATISDMLIAIREVTVATGGVKKKAYEFHAEPILYTYAKSVGQVISLPIKLLETKSKVNSTDEIIILREYLLRRIEGMKNGKNRLSQNKILYGSIYDELSLENPTNNKTKIIRQHTKKLLEFWIGEKYLKSFSEYKDGKTIKGVEVKF